MDHVGSLSFYRIPADGGGSVALRKGQRLSVKIKSTRLNVLVRVRSAGYEAGLTGGVIVVEGVVRKCSVYQRSESTDNDHDSGEREHRKRKRGGEESKAF